MNILKRIFKNRPQSKTKNAVNTFDIDQLLTSDKMNNSIISLDNYICELCSWGEQMDKLTEPQKIFYYNQNIEREINNGGFEQFFYNSSGNFSHETVHALQMINAGKTADLLQEAIEQFPDKVVLKDRDERIEVLTKIDANAKDIWEELDLKFFKYADDLNALNIQYVTNNKQAFSPL